MGLHSGLRRGLILALLLLVVGAARQDAQARGGAASANELFGAVEAPTADRRAEVIGTYARGCLRGAAELPVSGPGWDVMRLSRNRNWGHPSLVAFIERLAAETRRAGGAGLLIGDMAQPRGGPLRYGHASHQIGLDVDVWLIPPPKDRLLSEDDRESLAAVSMVKDGRYAVDVGRFGLFQAGLIRRAAEHPEVARVFVNPGIKKALCITAEGDRSWLGKLRPWWGHDEHMHVRLRCPDGQASCEDQDPPPDGDGCGADLRRWLAGKPYTPPTLLKPARPVAMTKLPPACRAVLREP